MFQFGCKYLWGNIKHYFLPKERTALEITAKSHVKEGAYIFIIKESTSSTDLIDSYFDA